ncbi:DUF6232 family protein [Rhizomonospora bruguierae]|uniref:DUF6232 family protein n=1 Tax=Rhizomonospora bruguierae TaxID=1581705 RepID=UPI001BCFED9A|nr:DUF6232 family protein [Micromonospora sp. NBRC 107566]
MDATRSTSGKPAPGKPAPPLVNQHPRVAGGWLIVADRRFAITELSRLRTARGPRDPLTMRSLALSVVLAGAVGTVLASAAPEPPAATTIVAASAIVLVPLAMAFVGHRLRPRRYELWADYRGMATRLLVSDSERQYNQICRALVRAREQARLGPAYDPWPSLDPWNSIPR